jgi:mono/diheme cytochrome c family protein
LFLFLSGLLLGATLICASIYFYFASGRAPVYTSDPELPFESALAGRALRSRMRKEVPKSISTVGTTGDLMAGARLYGRQCAVCHGLPVGRVTAIASGMYPPPPQLFHNQGARKPSLAEDYWKISNGIRFTGMPGFRESLTPTEIWQISLLLGETSPLPPPVFKELTSSQ